MRTNLAGRALLTLLLCAAALAAAPPASAATGSWTSPKDYQHFSATNR